MRSSLSIILFLILYPALGYSVFLFPPRVQKGQLIGHRGSNPPIPIYEPDKIRISYIEEGRHREVYDASGALTIVIIRDALESIDTSAQMKSLRPATLLKALDLLEQSDNKDVKSRIAELRSLIDKDGLFATTTRQKLNELTALVENSGEYQTTSKPEFARQFYDRIRGTGITSKPEDFIFNLGDVTARPVGESRHSQSGQQ